MHDDELRPGPDDRFTFGLWTVGNPGRDPFGDCPRARRSIRSTRSSASPSSARGASACTTTTWCRSDASARGARPHRRALRASALERHRPQVVPMATTNLFGHPAFKDGAFTSNDRARAPPRHQKTMRAIDLGAELGAAIVRLLGRARGLRGDGGQGHPSTRSTRYREAINFLCEYVLRPGLRDALRHRAQAERAARRHLLPTIGHALAFIHARPPRAWAASIPRWPTRRWRA